MQRRLIATAALTSLAALATASPALAQGYQYGPDEGPYIGVGFGYTKTGLDLDMTDGLREEGFTVMGTSGDDSDIGFKVFAGYQFNPHFAIEASYVDFGKFSASASAEENRDNGENGELTSVKTDVSLDGFGFALVGRLPIQDGFSLHGKLGLIAWDADIERRDSKFSGSLSFSNSEDGIDAFYGVGAEYMVDRLMLRFEFERYDMSDSGEDFDVDLTSVSIGYRF